MTSREWKREGSVWDEQENSQICIHNLFCRCFVVLLLSIWEPTTWVPGQSFPDEGVLAGIYCRFHWRQWEKLGWRMANNCTITALCWMIKLSSQTRQEVGGRGDLWKVMQSFLLSACLWKVVAKAENNPAFKRNDWERFVFFCCLLSIHFWIVCVLKACINLFSYFFL